MTDALTLARNDVPVPAWWPTGKYAAIVSPDEWGVADCNAFKERLGWRMPTFNAKDLPHNTLLPQGTYLLYSNNISPMDGVLCLASHLVDKKYRLSWDRSADIDLYLPYYCFNAGTSGLFSYFTTIYSTETEDFPEEWDILDAG